MVSCFLIGKDTSVCVRFFTAHCETLKPWIEHFENGPCHVHCHDCLDVVTNEPTCATELKSWLASSYCASAVILIDPHMPENSDPAFLELCAQAKAQGVFIGLFVDGSIQPNWTLPIQASSKFIQAKVNEILGVVRFAEFTPSVS